MSHETIYQTLFVQGRGGLRKELTALSALGADPAPASPSGSGSVNQGRLTEMVMISERPAEVDDRAVPGHWEGDLIIGTERPVRGRHPGRTQLAVRDADGAARRARRRTGP